MKNTLIIGDPHEPFCDSRYLPFCKRIYKAFNCKRVVCIGDLVDNHSISYHEHDPELWSPLKEMEETDKKLKKWFKTFPEVYLTRGNHDQLVDRKGKTVGLPKRCFKEYRDMWNLPDGWVDDFEFIFDGVKYINKEDRQQYALKSKIVVLAASACSSARILLNSKSEKYPNGLGNSSGMIGKYLHDSTGTD